MNKYRVSSAISVTGFAIAISIVILLGAFISNERSFDKHIDDLDNIYRIVRENDHAELPENVKESVIQNIPDVSTACHYRVDKEEILYNEKNYSGQIISTDNGFFKIFKPELTSGNIVDFSVAKNDILISESLAKTLFGDKNPLGKVINISHKKDVIIVGVIKDLPKQSSLWGNVICSTELRIRYSTNSTNGVRSLFYCTLLKTHKDTDVKKLEEKISEIVNNEPYYIANKKKIKVHLLKYKDTYFTPVRYDKLKHANVNLIYLLSLLSFVLLIFAVFNYVNFSIAETLSELNKIGVHQVFGASRNYIVKRFMGDSFFKLVLSVLLSIFFIILFNPILSNLLGKEISLSSLFVDEINLVYALLSFIGVIIVSALYPAILAIRSNPGLLIRNQITKSNKFSDIRTPLNIIQFAATIIVIISLITIKKQIYYINNKDLGFSTEQLVKIPVHYKLKDKVSAIIDKFNSLSVVKRACYSYGTPGSIWNSSSNNKLGRVNQIGANHTFLETFGIKLTSGRFLYPDEKKRVCVINKQAFIQAGWESYEGKKLFGAEVVGLIEDFHYNNLYRSIGALSIETTDRISHITVRLNAGNTSESMKQIKREFLAIAEGFDFNYTFYDHWYDQMYKQEEDRANAIQLLSILSIILSCLGLFGLADFTLKKRTKEIGIRKVNGASIFEVIVKLNTRFVKWVAVSFLIGAPIAFYVMEQWLESFAYKTSFSWWIFALAGIITLGIALLTVSWKCFSAATRNPVEAIRYE